MKLRRIKTNKKLDFYSPLVNFYDSLLTIIYPQECRICRRSVESQADGYVCRECWRKTKIFSGEEILCRKCGAFLRDGISNVETFCHACDEDFYDSASAVGLYEKGLLISILNLKNEPYLAKNVENLFYEAFLNSNFQDATQVIPVPLSKMRFSERGHNQSFILAQSLAKRTGLEINDKSLIRESHTVKHRAVMDRKARLETVKKAFGITKPRLIENQKIILIDDVFTSGATVSSCARVLKENGAEKVYVLTVARTI